MEFEKKSIAQHFIKTGIIIQMILLIYTVFTFFLSDNLAFILNNFSAKQFDSFYLVYILMIGIVVITINFYGVTKISNSISWSIWFIVIGAIAIFTNLLLFNLNLLIGILYLVGGIKSLIERKTPRQQKTSSSKLSDELEKLNELDIENIIDDEEFKKAKQKLLDNED